MNLIIGFKIILIFFFTFLIPGNGMIKAQDGDEVPVLDIQQTEFTICPDESVIMEVSISGTPPVFIAITHDSKTDTIRSPEGNVLLIALSDTGYYYVDRYGDSTHTVATSEIIHVDAHPQVQVRLDGGGIFCSYDDPVPITATFEGTPPFELIYLYNNDPDTIVTDQYSYTFNELNDFEIAARIVSDKNCTAETNIPASISIIQVPQPPIFGDTSVCKFTNSLYTSQQMGHTPQWEIPSGAQAREGIISNGSFVAVTWVYPGNHTVNLHLTDLSSGCQSLTTSLSVEVLDQPPIHSDLDTFICFDYEDKMHIDFPSQPGDVIFWPELNAYGASIDIYEEGTFSFILTDQYECADTGYIDLVEICVPEFHVPEAFTPNGDQLNDVLEIFGVYFNLKFTIFSPTGQELFYSEDKSSFWDGTHNGKELPNGRYYWHADYTDKYGQPYTQSGYVMLIR